VSGTQIAFFTGTGNSLWVARELAARLDGGLVSIAALAQRERITLKADALGIVFPVYYAGLPNLVRRFAERLELSEGAYVFGVATYGGAAGDSLRALRRVVERRGRAFYAGFGVHMPQNAFRKPWENRARIYRRAHRRVECIVRRVEARDKGFFYENVPLQLLLTPLHPWLRRMTTRHLEEISQAPSGLGIERLIPLADWSFAVTESCTGCETCAQVCPVGNIEMVGGKPVWRHRCENCLACFNWCPTRAVEGALVRSAYRYHHPNVTARDIVRQRSPG
jgi:ferredoxin